ncbi:hypothetical protein B0T14DRAFT_518470 [Immersiella caudata]|uniref:Uncharacterized protein n=1 Tax=Immersiella caudata TaxID=314043 RepID=A0AA39WP75_9PEZI|nr:hypothetical protein B0T14DRAFT_518470 [Immersiella caudata]
MPKPPTAPRLTWPKTKLTFYILWTLQISIYCILLLLSFVPIRTKPPSSPDDTSTRDRVTTLLYRFGVPLANFTLFYYLSVKIRVVLDWRRGARLGTGDGPSPVGTRSRWFESAVATQEFWVSERRGAAILLVSSTVWIPAVALTTLGMIIPVMFVGKGFGALIILLLLVVSGPSLIGHFLYVWGRSLKVLAMGSAKRREVGQEDAEDADLEMLLPSDSEEGRS